MEGDQRRLRKTHLWGLAWDFVCFSLGMPAGVWDFLLSPISLCVCCSWACPQEPKNSGPAVVAPTPVNSLWLKLPTLGGEAGSRGHGRSRRPWQLLRNKPRQLLSPRGWRGVGISFTPFVLNIRRQGHPGVVPAIHCAFSRRGGHTADRTGHGW